MTTVTTPGESVDIVVTDYGVAVNPRRPDLLEALKAADCVPLKTIEELRDIAYSIVGEPEKVQFGDRIRGHHRGPRRHCHGRRPRSQAFLFPRRLSDIA